MSDVVSSFINCRLNLVITPNTCHGAIVSVLHTQSIDTSYFRPWTKYVRMGTFLCNSPNQPTWILKRCREISSFILVILWKISDACIKPKSCFQMLRINGTRFKIHTFLHFILSFQSIVPSFDNLEKSSNFLLFYRQTRYFTAVSR